jgi:hypothetical protein
MATVQLDFEEGFSASHDFLTGWDYTRMAIVEGIPTTTSTDDLITQAELLLTNTPDPSSGSLTGIIGTRGSKYSMGDSGIHVYLKAFVPEIKSPNCVMFRIVYRGYPKLTYSLGGSLNQIESNLDVNQNPIIVSYTYNSSYGSMNNGGGTPAFAGQRQIQGVMTPRDSYEPAFSVKFLIVAGSNLSAYIRGQNYTITNGDGTSLMTLVGMFKGTCNNAPYQIGIINGTKHQWKIVDVTGTSDDQGLTYIVTMTFQFRPTGWDKTVTFINPDTGMPPPDLILSTVQVTDGTFPQYASKPGASTVVDIGATIAATADESTFPSFGFTGTTFPDVNN